MRTFKKSSAGSVPDGHDLTQHLAGLDIDLTLRNTAVALCIGTVTHEIAFAVLKIQRRINSVSLYPYGLGPLAVYIIRPHIEVAL